MALGPVKSLPMNMLMMYMAGNTVIRFGVADSKLFIPDLDIPYYDGDHGGLETYEGADGGEHGFQTA